MAAVHIGTAQNRFYVVFGRSLLEETRKWKKPMYVTILQAHINNINPYPANVENKVSS